MATQRSSSRRRQGCRCGCDKRITPEPGGVTVRNSIALTHPARSKVNRGVEGPGGKTITYNGLYKVKEYTFVAGKSGHKIFRFLLVRLKKGQAAFVKKQAIMHKMVGNQSDKYSRWKTDYSITDFIDPKTGKRKDKKDFATIGKRPRILDPHLIIADISGGQERRPIPGVG